MASATAAPRHPRATFCFPYGMHTSRVPVLIEVEAVICAGQLEVVTHAGVLDSLVDGAGVKTTYCI